MRVPTVIPGARTPRGIAAVMALAMFVTACGSTAPTEAPAPSAAPALSATPATQTLSAAASSTAVPAASTAPTPTPSLAALPLLWEQGGPTPSSPETWQPAIDPATGNVWVAASFDSKYWIFSPSGKYLESWGTPGTAPGQLALTTHEPDPSPFGTIAFLPDGSFYIADIGNNRVQHFDKNRTFVAAFGSFGAGDGQFARAWGLRTDGTTLYVSDDSRNDIQAFSLEGKFLRSIPVTNGFFALDPKGRLLATDFDGQTGLATTLSVRDPQTGADLASYPVPARGAALGLAVDTAGDVYLNIVDPQNAPSNPIALLEFDPAGKVMHSWSTAGETAAVAPDGKAIYIGSNWPVLRKYALPTP